MLRRFLSLPFVSFVAETGLLCGRIGVARSAAALSYFLILTLFPLLIWLHAFIGRFHLDLAPLLSSLGQVLPPEVLALLEDYLSYVSAVQSPALLWASLFTLLFSASAGLRTLFLTLGELFQAPRRHGIGHIFLSVMLAALFLVTIYLSVTVIFTGDWFFRLLEGRLPRRLFPLAALGGLWRWLRYLLLFSFLLLLVLALYRVGVPPSHLNRRAALGAALATALALAACSAVFSWFIGLSSRYALVYGSLASLVILLVWLYVCGYVLLLGAVACRVWTGRKKDGQPFQRGQNMVY